MKKNLFLLSLFFVILSCSKEDIVDNNFSPGNELTSALYDNSITPSYVIKPSSDWRNWERITLNSGETVTVPWSKAGASVHFSKEICEDFEPEDGWDLLWSGISGEFNTDKYHNYLIFYNRLSGILRVLYFNEMTTIQNGALWQLNLEGPQTPYLMHVLIIFLILSIIKINF